FPLSSRDEFKAILQSVKTEHQKATHHCFAYRLGFDKSDFRVSDDGEPSGTAGRPILGQIDSRKLTNTLIVVVRYFGGTLLGVPGLVNAYKTAATFALQVTPVVEKQIEDIYRLRFDYTVLNEVMTIVKLFHCSILSQDLQLFPTMTIGISKRNKELVLGRLKEIRNLESDSIPG
ncbi:MAG: YigZ family protein, partial [Bacteroidota bacterium]|nr:YigZ family protein [Bacteroidota bacterium]